MPDSNSDSSLTGAERTARRMRADAAELTLHGLGTHLHESQAGLDLTATRRRADTREIEIFLDEDSYAELRYWNHLDASAAEVAATALPALDAVTPPKSGAEPG